MTNATPILDACVDAFRRIERPPYDQVRLSFTLRFSDCGVSPVRIVWVREGYVTPEEILDSDKVLAFLRLFIDQRQLDADRRVSLAVEQASPLVEPDDMPL
jgi:hypothetical protein